MRQLHERFGADLPVILVSESRTDPLDRTAGLMLGADDYLAKPLDSGELLARVRRSLRRAAPPKTNGNGNGHADSASLSPREREILTLLAEGRTQSQIAAALVISSKTVATHIQHILAKLGVHTQGAGRRGGFPARPRRAGGACPRCARHAGHRVRRLRPSPPAHGRPETTKLL